MTEQEPTEANLQIVDDDAADYEEDEEDAAAAMAAMMGFSAFGTQGTSKKRKYNPETDAAIGGQALEEVDRGGKRGKGSGGNQIPLGKARTFGAANGANAEQQHEISRTNPDEIILDDDDDDDEDGDGDGAISQRGGAGEGEESEGLLELESEMEPGRRRRRDRDRGRNRGKGPESSQTLDPSNLSSVEQALASNLTTRHAHQHPVSSHRPTTASQSSNVHSSSSLNITPARPLPPQADLNPIHQQIDAITTKTTYTTPAPIPAPTPNPFDTNPDSSRFAPNPNAIKMNPDTFTRLLPQPRIGNRVTVLSTEGEVVYDAEAVSAMSSYNTHNYNLQERHRDDVWYDGYFDPSFLRNPWEDLERERAMLPRGSWPAPPAPKGPRALKPQVEARAAEDNVVRGGMTRQKHGIRALVSGYEKKKLG